MSSKSTTYTIWITLLTNAGAEMLVSKLVRKGYGVAPAARDKNIIEGSDDLIARVLAIHLTIDVPEKESNRNNWALERVMEVVKDAGIMYYSIILKCRDTGLATWRAGNIVYSNNESITQGPYR